MDTPSTVPAAGRDGDWTVMKMTKKCRLLYGLFGTERVEALKFYDDICGQMERK